MANSHLSVSGAMTAFGSGLLLGCGYTLLHPDYREKNDLVIRMTLGGGAFVAGLYLFSPAGMRQAWLVSLG